MAPGDSRLGGRKTAFLLLQSATAWTAIVAAYEAFSKPRYPTGADSFVF